MGRGASVGHGSERLPAVSGAGILADADDAEEELKQDSGSQSWKLFRWFSELG
jgi:hypothetical protein